jgi:WD40 repeat protein/energy-coupling factor transporter ATP-binding protein EcfA2
VPATHDATLTDEIRAAIGRAARRLTPALKPHRMLVLVTTAALAPLIGTHAAGEVMHLFTTIVGSTGENVLASLIANLVMEGRRSEKDVEKALTNRLKAGGDDAKALVVDMSEFLKAVDGIRETVEAAGDEVRIEVIEGFRTLGSEVEELRWMLVQTKDMSAEIMRRMAATEKRERAHFEELRRSLRELSRSQRETIEHLRKGPPVDAKTAADGAEEGEPVEEVVPSGESPYQGLRAFDASEADSFFGRGSLVDELTVRLTESSFVVVVGASGSGKSSVVRAGLVPAASDGVLRGTPLWRSLVVEPGAHPLEELALRLAAEQNLLSSELARELRANPSGLDMFCRQLLAAEEPGTQFLLVVDQLEEVFTLCEDEEERRAFLDSVVETGQRGGPVAVVLVVRSDFYGECSTHPGLADALETRQVVVGPMSVAELREAIEKPAAASGLKLEPGLVETILEDVGTEPGALPLLSQALFETWKRRKGRTLTLECYVEAGGVRRAIANTADSVYEQRFSPQQQKLARSLFLRLTQLGEGTEATRRRAKLEELVARPTDKADVRAMLQILVDARLVTVGAGTVEVAHEALIREWPRLREWVAQDRKGVELRRRLSEVATDWERVGRGTDELYRGHRLRDALEYERQRPDELNPLERDFLRASSRAEETELDATRRRNRKLAALVAGLTVAFVGAVAAIAYARHETGDARRQRDIATARALIKASADAPLDQSLLLGVEAYDRNHAPEVRSNLVKALEESAGLEDVWRRPDPVTHLGAAGDTVAAAAGQSVAVRRVGSGAEPEVVLPEIGVVDAIAVGPRTGLISLGRDDGSVLVLRARAPAHTIARLKSDVRALALVEHERVLLAGTDAGRLVVLRLQGRRWTIVASESPGIGGLQALSVRRDNRAVALGGANGVAVLSWDGTRLSNEHRSREPTSTANVAFAPNGTLLSMDSYGRLARWNDDGAGLVSTPFRGGPRAASAFDVRDDGLIAIGDSSGVVTLVRAEGSRLREVTDGALVTGTDGVTALAFARKRLVASAGPVVTTWDPSRRTLQHPLRADGALQALAFGFGGRRLVAVGDGGFVWKFPRTAPQRIMTSFLLANDVAFGPRSRILAASMLDGKVALWRLQDHGFVSLPTPKLTGANRTVFEPRSERLVVATDSGLGLWDVEASKWRAHRGSAQPISAVAIAPDGTIAAGEGSKILLLTRKGDRFQSNPLAKAGHDVSALAYSPDGKLVASGDTKGVVSITRVDDGSELLPPAAAHRSKVNAVAFSPRGSTLASVGDDGHLLLWDVRSGVRLGEPLGPGEKTALTDVVFSPSGSTVAATSANGVLMWDNVLWGPPDAIVKHICAVVGRDLGLDEWRSLLLPGKPRGVCSKSA